MSFARETQPARLTLRSVSEGDAEFLHQVYASTRLEELAGVGWNGEQRENFLRMQFNAQRRYYESEYPGAEFNVILLGDQPVGRLYLHRRSREIRVMDLALLLPFRGQGIGSRLLTDILAEAARSHRCVTIHVESFNPAQRLYRRLGFQPVATNGVYQLLEWQPAVPSATPSTQPVACP